MQPQVYSNLFVWTGIDGQINKALLCGSIEVAVDLCLQEERWADAILLAARGGQELMSKAQTKYFQVCTLVLMFDQTLLSGFGFKYQTCNIARCSILEMTISVKKY